jgi:hypothetical protein
MGEQSMDLTTTVVKIAFFALPGFVACNIYRKLQGPSEKKQWEDFVEVLVFTVTSYLLYAVISGLLFRIPETQAATDNSLVSGTPILWLIKPDQELRWQDPLWASVAGLFLGFVASYINRLKIVNRLGKFLRATSRYGDEDVWEFYNNSPETPEWVVVRDHKAGLAYYGAIIVFSDSGRDRELILSDVTVFDNDDGKQLYEVARTYLCRKPEDLTIEELVVPKVNSSGGDKK